MKFKSISGASTFTKLLKILLFISEHLALCWMKSRRSRSENIKYSKGTFLCFFCISFYTYSIIMEGLSFKRSDFYKYAISNIGNISIISTGLILVVSCNINRFYFAFETPIWFKKLEIIESNLYVLGIGNDYKKQQLFLVLFINFVFCNILISLILEWASFNLNHNFSVSMLISYSLVFGCISLSCSCFNILFYIISLFFKFTNDKIVNCYFMTPILNYRRIFNNNIIKHFKRLIQIQDDLHEVKAAFQFMSALINLTVIATITILTVFHIYFLILYYNNTTIQAQLLKYSIVIYLFLIQFTMFTMVYVVQKCKYEVNINIKYIHTYSGAASKGYIRVKKSWKYHKLPFFTQFQHLKYCYVCSFGTDKI